MATCPTCGQQTSRLLEAEELFALLRDGTPHREVYIANDLSSWWVTYGGGQAHPVAVRTLVREGRVQRVYSDADGAYHIGKTLDMKATTEERKKHRRAKDAPLIYTDGTRAAR